MCFQPLLASSFLNNANMFWSPAFLTLSYWFDLSPLPFPDLVSRILFGGFGALLFFGIAGRIVARHHHAESPKLKKQFRASANAVAWLGVLGLLLFFFGFEQIQFFSARFWYVLWLLLAVLWVRSLILGFRRIIEEEEARRTAQSRDQYLPRAKGHR